MSKELLDTFLQALTVVSAIMLQVMCWGALILAVVLIAHTAGRSRREAWEKFARTYGLTFQPGSFSIGGACIVGVYRGCNLRIETFKEGKVTSTRVKLDANGSGSEKRDEVAKGISASLIPQEVLNLLIPYGPLGISAGKVEATAGGKRLAYQQTGVMTDASRLHCVCNLLSDLMDGYPVVAALGGIVAPPLQTIARENSLLGNVAVQMLKDIAGTTQRQLGDRAGRLLCPRCLAHFYAHRADLPWQFDETYYGCRLCYQSREFIECPQGVAAVLDAAWTGAQDLRDGLLRVNWLARRALFDFTVVEIVQASDEDVERFAVQVGNDADLLRRPLYAAMRCIVNPACGLSENTLRILRSTFGLVEISA